MLALRTDPLFDLRQATYVHECPTARQHITAALRKANLPVTRNGCLGTNAEVATTQCARGANNAARVSQQIAARWSAMTAT